MTDLLGRRALEPVAPDRAASLATAWARIGTPRFRLKIARLHTLSQLSENDNILSNIPVTTEQYAPSDRAQVFHGARATKFRLRPEISLAIASRSGQSS